jgi:hypothetical protein
MTQPIRPPADSQNDEHYWCTVPEVMGILGLKSRRSVEKLLFTGRIRSHKVLGRRKVPRPAVYEYLDSVEQTPADIAGA